MPPHHDSAMFSSSAPTPPLEESTFHQEEGTSQWHLDVLPDDRLFTQAQNLADLIVVVMGPTGAGKSTFINEYLGKSVTKVNHGLKSCTQGIECYTITLPEDHQKWPNRRLVLVDTPGFNDTQRGEWEILRKISVWLASVYDNNTRITGLVYLHSIGNPRVGGTALLSYDLFLRICGPDALSRVVMATTHWVAVSAYPDAGEIREQELKTEFWAKTLTHGACYKRIQMPQDINDAIEYILSKHFEPVATQIQEELVELDKRVAQTEAGQKLIDTLQERLRVPVAQGRDSPRRTSPRSPMTLPIHDVSSRDIDFLTPGDDLILDSIERAYQVRVKVDHSPNSEREFARLAFLLSVFSFFFSFCLLLLLLLFPCSYLYSSEPEEEHQQIFESQIWHLGPTSGNSQNLTVLVGLVEQATGPGNDTRTLCRPSHSIPADLKQICPGEIQFEKPSHV